MRAKIAEGGAISSVEVYVNQRRKLRVTGAKALKAIRVSALPRGRYTLEVRVKTRDGRTEKLTRRYGRAPAGSSPVLARLSVCELHQYLRRLL